MGEQELELEANDNRSQCTMDSKVALLLSKLGNARGYCQAVLESSVLATTLPVHSTAVPPGKQSMAFTA